MMNTRKRRVDWEKVKDRLRAAELALHRSSATDDTGIQEIFRRRAERLAEGPPKAPSKAETMPVLAFKVGEETYGIELRHLTQVFPDAQITPVPGSPDTLLGIANLEGEVRSVLSLRRLLRLPAGDEEVKHYILLLRHNGRQAGLRVEQIEDVRQVARDLATATDDAADQSDRYIQGLTRDRLILLRMDAIFSHFFRQTHQKPVPAASDFRRPENSPDTTNRSDTR